jgi:hypothetical protein
MRFWTSESGHFQSSSIVDFSSLVPGLVGELNSGGPTGDRLANQQLTGFLSKELSDVSDLVAVAFRGLIHPIPIGYQSPMRCISFKF